MKDDARIEIEGMQILIKHLGLLEAERFIALTKRDTFDYTKWRENQFNDMSVDTIFKEAAELRAQTERREEVEKALSRMPKAARRSPDEGKKPPARRRQPKRSVHA